MVVHLNRDPSLHGELQSILDETQDHLFDSLIIQHELFRYVIAYLEIKRKPFFLRGDLEEFLNLHKGFPHVYFLLFLLELLILNLEDVKHAVHKMFK